MSLMLFIDNISLGPSGVIFSFKVNRSDFLNLINYIVEFLTLEKSLFWLEIKNINNSVFYY